MSSCGHDHGARAPHALNPETPDGVAKAAAVPFGVTPVDETARQERIKRLKGLLDERIVFLDGAMGTSSSRLYVTPAEARRLYEEISEAFGRLSADRELADRRDPEHRPADAIPVEFVLLSYPVLDSPLPPAPEAP